MLRSNADDHLLYDPSWSQDEPGPQAEADPHEDDLEVHFEADLEVFGGDAPVEGGPAPLDARAAGRERTAARRRPPGQAGPAGTPAGAPAELSAPTTPAQVANDGAGASRQNRPDDVPAAPSLSGTPADTVAPPRRSASGDAADTRSAAMPDVTPPDPDARRDFDRSNDAGRNDANAPSRPEPIDSSRSDASDARDLPDDGIEWPEPVIDQDDTDDEIDATDEPAVEAMTETDDPNFDDDELSDYDEEEAEAEAARDEELGVPLVERDELDELGETDETEADEPAPAAAAPKPAAPVAPAVPASPKAQPAAEASEPPEEDVTPATPPKITSVTEVRTESDAATWNRPPAAEVASVPSRGEMARSLTWHVCPFCGHKNESAHQPCESCGMVDSSEARTATVRRGGPWFVRLPGNPGGPGMKFTVLQEMVRSGEIRSGTVVRGPSTQQLWTFAARVRGLSHMFGLCWNCNRRLQEPESGEEADDFCIYCGALLDAPSNPDQQLEAVRPSSPSRVSGGADLSPAGQKRLAGMPGHPHDGGGVSGTQGDQRMLPAPEPLALNDDPEGKGLLTTQELERVFNVGGRRGEVIGPEAFAGKPRPTAMDDDDDNNSTVGRIILGIAALAVIVVIALFMLDVI